MTPCPHADAARIRLDSGRYEWCSACGGLYRVEGATWRLPTHHPDHDRLSEQGKRGAESAKELRDAYRKVTGLATTSKSEPKTKRNRKLHLTWGPWRPL